MDCSIPSELTESEGLVKTLTYLQNGCQEMTAIGFSVTDENLDFAKSAFRAFHQGLTRAVLSKGTSDDEAVIALEPKKDILIFLLELHTHCKAHRNQVTSTINSLLSYEPWRATVASNQVLTSCIQGIGLMP